MKKKSILELKNFPNLQNIKIPTSVQVINSQAFAGCSSLVSIGSLPNGLNKIGYKYSIKEVQLASNNFACYFFNLEKKQCSIYHARPMQCRTFPFWDYFKENEEEVYKECPAIRNL